MAWRFDDLNQGTSFASSTRHRGFTQQYSMRKSIQNAYQLLAFKKSIRWEVSQYTMLKDEKYFGTFKRSLLVTATTHGCEEMKNGNYKPEKNKDSQDLFKQKQYFMYSVFNRVLQSDMGKTIVRKYAPTLNAQGVWNSFQSHMSTSSKGLNE